MEEATSKPRRPRADALRNRLRLLAAADEVFRASGSDAPLDQVARRAEVGIGTLYGHFPTRRALIAALLAERNQELFVHGDRLIEQVVTVDAVGEWVRAVVRHAATYQGLAVVLAESLGDDASEMHESCVRISDIGAELLRRAEGTGTLAPDASAQDVFTLINAAAWTREHAGEDQAERLIALTLEGLRRQNHPAR
ncbi:TetR/AcrR family transcriptional regulator [Nocardia yamanashiensis]|uniref:TetR/AcrR family transcriptional regulator n=1 Tax=Nocardia yamanashiensis TaxID=209247 RepID=UPI0008339117|nr:TetR/AcrR family transcriptional regulator [Nocardia yamanashiensis]